MRIENVSLRKHLVLCLCPASPGLVACGDGESSISDATEPTPTSLIETSEEAAGDHCTNGGVRIAAGMDEDADGTLDESEVTSTRYVCSGEAGASGETVTQPGSLVETYEEAAGDNCANGGVRIASGTDEDADGTLDESEVTSTRYVCNGAKGESTAANAATMTLTQDEPAGDNCANGGLALVTGVDTDGDSALSANEIQATRYVCRSSPGQMVTVSDAGDACVNGGARVTVGVDSDGDGTLSDTETTSETLVCASANVLLTSTAIPAGDECPSGGTRVSSGADLNGDGILSEGEEQSTTVVCATAQTLVRTETATNEQCSDGGFVLYSGADANGDGVLGDTEVTDAQALCVASIKSLEVYPSNALMGYPASVCALLTDGAAYCWGGNFCGRLGDGSTTDRATPMKVLGLEHVTSLRLSYDEGFAVHSDGTVSCWGSGTCMAQASATAPVLPRKVPGLLNVVGEVASTWKHACVLTSDQRVYCWGANASGQSLGGTATTDLVLVPTETEAARGALKVEADWGGTCVITAGRSAKCWGNNGSGTLGLGDLDVATEPTVVALPATVAELDLSVGNGCALLTDGRLFCWGDYTGNAAQPTSTVPVEVALDGMKAVRVKRVEEGGCVELESRAVRCWGSTPRDHLRLGIPGDYQTPQPSAIAVGQRYWSVDGISCAISNAGVVACTEVPIRTTPTLSPAATGLSSVAGNYARYCGVETDGTVRCWGTQEDTWISDSDTAVFRQTGGSWKVPGLTSIVQVDKNGCAINATGELYCWGQNDRGQVGNGTTVAQPTPVSITLGASPVAVVRRSFNHTCALDQAGSVYCWGYNGSGQLGDGTTINRSAPVLVSVLSNVVDLATGGTHTCAVKSDGSLYCWGANGSKQVLDTSSENVFSSPTLVSGLSDVVDVAAMGSLTCALDGSGQVYCWGTSSGAYYPGGSYQIAGARIAYGPISGIVDAVQIDLAGGAGCALEKAGDLKCWGDNNLGQLGNGTQTASFRDAVSVSSLSGVTAFVAGGYARTQDGQAYTWGSDRYLGLGDSATLEPKAIPEIHDGFWSVVDL